MRRVTFNLTMTDVEASMLQAQLAVANDRLPHVPALSAAMDALFLATLADPINPNFSFSYITDAAEEIDE